MIKTKRALYVYTLTALVFTVPWFFFPDERLPRTILGFPTWAFYAVVASILYAVFIAYCLQRHWDLSAGDDADDAID